MIGVPPGHTSFSWRGAASVGPDASPTPPGHTALSWTGSHSRQVYHVPQPAAAVSTAPRCCLRRAVAAGSVACSVQAAVRNVALAGQPVADRPGAPTLVAISLSNRPKLHQHTWPGWSEYCADRGYSWRPRDHVMDTSRHPAWSKILFLIETLLACSGSTTEFVVWIDDDILLTDHSRSLYDKIMSEMSHTTTPSPTHRQHRQHRQHRHDTDGPDRYPVFLVSEEPYDVFNTGILACRCDGANNARAVAALARVWRYAETHLPQHLSSPSSQWEQSVMAHLYLHDDDAESNDQRNNTSGITSGTGGGFAALVHLAPYGLLQRFLRDRKLTAGERWRAGDFTVHLTGMSLKKRLQCIGQVKQELEDAAEAAAAAGVLSASSASASASSR